MAASTNNYLDYAKGADLVKPITVLLDQGDSLSPGNLLRFMRLEQINDTHSSITAYLTEDSWGSFYIPSSGIVGESRFLVDGADLKSRLNFEPWSSNPLRIRPTKRKEVRLECLLNLNNNSELIDNIESPLYSGNFTEFSLPTHFSWDDSTIGTLTDSLKFRKRCQIVNAFAKYTNDKNSRYCWFHLEKSSLALYGSDADLSLIKIASPVSGPILEQETNSSPLRFSIPAKHLNRILQLTAEQHTLSFRLDTTKQYVQFWSQLGWFILPSISPEESSLLSSKAPIYLNQCLPFTNVSQRMFSAQELSYKVAIQKQKKKSDPDGIRLECTESHLVMSKVSDILRRELSHAMFAELDGKEAPWTPIVVYQAYFLTAITAALKFCKQFTEEELFESGCDISEGDFDFEEEAQYEDENYLGLASDTDVKNNHLLTITQQYLPNKDLWCVYIDPVPYSEECAIYLPASTPAKNYDRSEDNV